MNSRLFTVLFCCLSISVFGQKENILLDRGFWKSSPDLATIKAKIAEGHDPAAMTEHAFDATIYSMLEKAPNESILHLLSLKGNEVDKVTHDGRNYLMWAAYAGNVDIVKHLIEAGSDISLIDDHGYSVIAFCASTGQSNPKIYDVLIENGAELNVTNRKGANPLLLIAPHLGDDLSMIDYFQSKGLKIESTDKNGNGLFNYAAMKGNKALMEKAIEWNLPYKEKNLIGGNAIIFASRGYRSHTNDLALYQYLSDLGLEANVVTKNGETPLHNIAFRTKDSAIFDFFIQKGVDINQANKDGNTLLLNTINGGNGAIALQYIPKVEDLNHQNKKGHTALTFAVRKNLSSLVQTLIESNANTDIVDKSGNSLAGHLFETFHSNKQKAFETILVLLEKEKVDFKAAQAKGNSLLHIAVDQYSPFLIERALSLGVDLNGKNDNGLTPIHLAAMKAKDPAILNLLIEKGADKNIKTDFEETVYDLASENELLQKNGFDLEVLKK